MEPETNPKLIEMGWTTCCRQVVKCSHDYCGKYKWIMDRAKHYAEICGSTVESVIEEWEKARTYWYMNYYQECNQPLIKGENIIMYDAWIAELTKRFGEDSKQWKFKCPACGHVQSIQDFLDHNIENPDSKVYYNCIGRYVPGTGCNWTLGGLLNIHNMTVVKDLRSFHVFEMADTVLTPEPA